MPIAVLLEQFMRHFLRELKAGRYHKLFIAGMVLLFKHDCSIFKQACFKMSEDDIRKLSTVS
jgi:hypothetical protein